MLQSCLAASERPSPIAGRKGVPYKASVVEDADRRSERIRTLNPMSRPIGDRMNQDRDWIIKIMIE